MQTETVEFLKEPGVIQTLAEGVRCIIAPNPSPMTYWGTNTYIVGQGELVVIDPGPEDDSHLEAILAAPSAFERIAHIVVTHTHKDHSPLARRLSQATGAPIYGFGDAFDGRSEIMSNLAETSDIGGGEGLDTDFEPDIRLMHGARLDFSGGTLKVWHTPGHIGNHICLAWNGFLFSGDHVMGWASSMVSPPDGDLTDFMASCRMLQNTSWKTFFPGHGAPIDDPQARLKWLIKHRETREAEILKALEGNGTTARDIAQHIYVDLPRDLLGAATRNVLAHLIDLSGRDLVDPIQGIDSQSLFKLR